LVLARRRGLRRELAIFERLCRGEKKKVKKKVEGKRQRWMDAEGK
jgi:hypothetical protein